MKQEQSPLLFGITPETKTLFLVMLYKSTDDQNHTLRCL